MADRRDATGLVPGLAYRYGEGRADSVAGVALLGTTPTGTVPTVQLRGDEQGDRWGITLEGWITVAADGIWEFALTSDDGSVLWIDGEKIVDNDGYHGPDAKQNAVALRSGVHRLRVVMFQGGGAKALSLGWRRQGEAAFSPVPGSALFRSP